MLTITDTPMVEITEVVQPCFQELPVELCEPCRQLNIYLPKIKAPTLKENSKIKVFAKAMLEIDDELMQKICNLCFTAETEDCNCLLLYGKSVGAETSYFTIDSTNCMKFGYKKTVNQCCKTESLILQIPEGFSAWKIPESQWQLLQCNESVASLNVVSYSDDLSGISVGTGGVLWESSQQILDEFLQTDSQQYAQSIEGDLQISTYQNKPILFIKNNSLIDKTKFYFLMGCSGSDTTFLTFTEPFIQEPVESVLICKREVFAFCQQLCQVCNFHSLDVCNNEADFEFYKKIVKFKAKYFNKTPTRKNIVDALIDWFGTEAHVLDAIYPEIFWSLGRAATEQELAIMPFVYSMMPVYDGIDLIFTQEL